MNISYVNNGNNIIFGEFNMFDFKQFFVDFFKAFEPKKEKCPKCNSEDLKIINYCDGIGNSRYFRSGFNKFMDEFYRFRPNRFEFNYAVEYECLNCNHKFIIRVL